MSQVCPGKCQPIAEILALYELHEKKLRDIELGFKLSLCAAIATAIDNAGHSLRVAAAFVGISHAQVVAIRKAKVDQISIKSLLSVAKAYSVTSIASLSLDHE